MPWEKQFDEKKALNRAVRIFWDNGYDATSMTDLLDAMGIQKGSFYATYGSKREVLLNALRSYMNERYTGFAALKRDPSPRAAMERHLRTISDEACGIHGDSGCFVVNVALELSTKDSEIRELIQDALAGHEQLYQDVLQAAVDKGELPASLDVRTVARSLLALVLGMRVMSRASIPRSVIESVRDHAVSLVSHS